MLCIFCESKFEAQQLLAKLNDYKIVTDYLFNIYEIKLNGKDIILVQAGEGKVNFAYAMGVITEK
ncbi:MAG: 5'-nucleosidase, partial [Turicibacter sanguinis]